jgi:SAM-dependent methyltransferase
MTAPAILDSVAEFFTGCLETHGPTARGVDWNSTATQVLRFEQLLKLCPQTPCTLGDYGCGYGALYDYTILAGRDVSYRGYDIAPAMVTTARQLHADCPERFANEAAALDGLDFIVASGIFNKRLEYSEPAWRAHVEQTIEQMASLARKGFGFNMLTSYSDPDKMRPDLYYADPCAFFDYCKRRFSRHVALLHDYGLYEFTLLVRF